MPRLFMFDDLGSAASLHPVSWTAGCTSSVICAVTFLVLHYRITLTGQRAESVNNLPKVVT